MRMTFYFDDEASGEDFFVDRDTLEEAIKVANEYFEDPKFISVISDEEAEYWGLDTY